MCWSSVEAAGEGGDAWRVAGVKALNDDARCRVHQLLFLPASKAVLAWLTTGEIVIFDSGTYATLYTYNYEGAPSKSCILSHQVELKPGVSADEVALLRLSKTSQRIVVGRLRVGRTDVKRGATIVAFLSDCEESVGASQLLSAAWVENVIFVALDTKFVLLSNRHRNVARSSAIGEYEVRWAVDALAIPVPSPHGPQRPPSQLAAPEGALDRMIHKLTSRLAVGATTRPGDAIPSGGRPGGAAPPRFAALLPTRDPREVLAISYPFALVVNAAGDVVKGKHPLDLSRSVGGPDGGVGGRGVHGAVALGSKLLLHVQGSVLVYEWCAATEGDSIGDVCSEELRLVQDISVPALQPGVPHSVFLAGASHAEVAAIATPSAFEVLKPEDTERQAMYLLDEGQLSAAWRLAKGMETGRRAKRLPCPPWVQACYGLILVAFLREGRWGSAIQVLQGMDPWLFHPAQVLYHFWELLPAGALERVDATAARLCPQQSPGVSQRLQGLARTPSPVLAALAGELPDDGADGRLRAPSSDVSSAAPSGRQPDGARAPGGRRPTSRAGRSRALAQVEQFLELFLLPLIERAVGNAAASAEPHTFPGIAAVLRPLDECAAAPDDATRAQTLPRAPSSSHHLSRTCSRADADNGASPPSASATPPDCVDLFLLLRLQLLQRAGKGAELEAACRASGLDEVGAAPDITEFAAAELGRRGNVHAQALLLCGLGHSGRALQTWRSLELELRLPGALALPALAGSMMALPPGRGNVGGRARPGADAAVGGPDGACADRADGGNDLMSVHVELQRAVAAASAAEALCVECPGVDDARFARELEWLMTAHPQAALAVLLFPHGAALERRKWEVLALWPCAEDLLFALERDRSGVDGAGSTAPETGESGPKNGARDPRGTGGGDVGASAPSVGIAASSGGEAAEWSGASVRDVASALWLKVRFLRARARRDGALPDGADRAPLSEYASAVLGLALAASVRDATERGLSDEAHPVYGGQEAPVALTAAFSPAAARLYRRTGVLSAVPCLRPLAASLPALRGLLCAELRGLGREAAAALLELLGRHDRLLCASPPPLLAERALLLERLDTLEGHMAALSIIALDLQDVHAATAYLDRVIARMDVQRAAQQRGASASGQQSAAPALERRLSHHLAGPRQPSGELPAATEDRHEQVKRGLWEYLQRVVLEGGLISGQPPHVAAFHACVVQRAAGSGTLTARSLLDALDATLGPDAPLAAVQSALTHLVQVKRHEGTAAHLEAKLRWKHKLLLTGEEAATRGAYLLHSDAGSEFYGPGLPEPQTIAPTNRQQIEVPTCAYCIGNGRSVPRVFVTRGGHMLPRQWIKSASEPPCMVYSKRNLMCHDCALLSGLPCYDLVPDGPRFAGNLQ